MTEAKWKALLEMEGMMEVMEELKGHLNDIHNDTDEVNETNAEESFDTCSIIGDMNTE